MAHSIWGTLPPSASQWPNTFSSQATLGLHSSMDAVDSRNESYFSRHTNAGCGGVEVGVDVREVDCVVDCVVVGVDTRHVLK